MLNWPLITPQAELADVIKANDEVLFVDGICLLDAIASPAAVGTLNAMSVFYCVKAGIFINF